MGTKLKKLDNIKEEKVNQEVFAFNSLKSKPRSVCRQHIRK